MRTILIIKYDLARPSICWTVIALGISGQGCQHQRSTARTPRFQLSNIGFLKLRIMTVLIFLWYLCAHADRYGELMDESRAKMALINFVAPTPRPISIFRRQCPLRVRSHNSTTISSFLVRVTTSQGYMTEARTFIPSLRAIKTSGSNHSPPCRGPLTSRPLETCKQTDNGILVFAIDVRMETKIVIRNQGTSSFQSRCEQRAAVSKPHANVVPANLISRTRWLRVCHSEYVHGCRPKHALRTAISVYTALTSTDTA